MLFGEAEAVMVQLVTFTVTEAVQAAPPPLGVQVAVYVVVEDGLTLLLLPFPAPLSQLTLPPGQPV